MAKHWFEPAFTHLVLVQQEVQIYHWNMQAISSGSIESNKSCEDYQICHSVWILTVVLRYICINYWGNINHKILSFDHKYMHIWFDAISFTALCSFKLVKICRTFLHCCARSQPVLGCNDFKTKCVLLVCWFVRFCTEKTALRLKRSCNFSHAKWDGLTDQQNMFNWMTMLVVPVMTTRCYAIFVAIE